MLSMDLKPGGSNEEVVEEEEGNEDGLAREGFVTFRDTIVGVDDTVAVVTA